MVAVQPEIRCQKMAAASGADIPVEPRQPAAAVDPPGGYPRAR
jgi:hypothetical protein